LAYKDLRQCWFCTSYAARHWSNWGLHWCMVEICRVWLVWYLHCLINYFLLKQETGRTRCDCAGQLGSMCTVCITGESFVIQDLMQACGIEG